MKERRIRVLAWGLCTVAVAGAMVRVILWASRLAGSPTFADVLEALGWGLAMTVVFSVLAALIIARQPRNRVGWLLMVVALALSLNPSGVLLGQLSGPPAAMTPGLWLLLWLDGWSWIPVIFPVLLIPLFFPTGQPPSPRWRWIGWLAVLMWIAFMVLVAFAPEGGPINADWKMANPVGFIPQKFFDGPFILVWGIGLVATVVGSVASLYVRYRRAGSGERQQIKWLLFAGAFFAVVYTVGLLLPDITLASSWADLLLILSILSIPIAIAIAIFRYRLWDLEVVVNRTLIYGLLTTLLAGIFAASIALTTEAGKQLLGEGSRTMGAAISALIVAVVFQPLRTWIEGAVNRRFYPKKMDLASGLVEVQPEYWGFLDGPTLLRISMEHVRRVLGTNHAAFFLASEGGEFRLAQQVVGSADGVTSVPVSEEQRHELEKKRVIAAQGSALLAGHVPVYVDRGKTNEVLGLLSIGPRENGKGYSGDDLKGLAELGGKIGLALNAIQLGSTRGEPGLAPVFDREGIAQVKAL